MKKGRIQITEDVNSVKAKINFEFRLEVDKRLRSALPIITARVGLLISSRLRNSPHGRSIIQGKLKEDFGLTDSVAQSAMSQLVESVKTSVKIQLVRPQRGSSNLAYSMLISILPDGLSGQLKYIGRYYSNGYPISWMEWLLTRGVEVIIEDYFVSSHGTFPTSRSDGPIMLQSGKSSELFRVDPEFAGTENDNFVVNTLRESLPEIGDIMRSYL